MEPANTSPFGRRRLIQRFLGNARAVKGYPRCFASESMFRLRHNRRPVCAGFGKYMPFCRNFRHFYPPTRLAEGAFLC